MKLSHAGRLSLLIWWAGFGSFTDGRAATTPAAVTIENAPLRVVMETPSGLVTAEDRRSGLVWRQHVPIRSAKGAEWGKVTTKSLQGDERLVIQKAASAGRAIRAEATWRGHPFTVLWELAEREAALAVTIDTAERGTPLPWKPEWTGVTLMTYPYAFHHASAGREAVVPVDEGVVYSTEETDAAADPRRWNAWWLHERLSMPWWGVTDGKRGAMTQVDTPFDCLFSVQWIETPQGERTLPQVTWLAEKGALGYARRVTFRFFDAGGYVAMAKAFRQQERSRGAFRSWDEKVKANPTVGRLCGALDVWSQAPVTAGMIAALRDAGIGKAIVAKSRAGDAPPGQGTDAAAIAAAVKAGYLIGAYHNFSWIHGSWIEKDPSLKDAAIAGSGGDLKFIGTPWDPKGRLDRCPGAHLEILLGNARAERGLGINYFFTDCTTTGGSIKECHHPKHPLTRREGAGRLDEALGGVGGLGVIVGSERGKWWATASTHVFEGIETLIEYGGQYYGKGGSTHWVGPYLTDKPGFQELCLGYDFNPARRVPLFQLVYHDSVYCTRRWNQDPGRDPLLWNRHDLMNTLYGIAPLIFMHPEADNVIGTPGWEKVKDRYLQTYRSVCGWHEKIGFDDMTEHRFLSDNRLVQEARFASGWPVVVNFGDRPWADPRGFAVKAVSHHVFRE